MEDGIQPKRLPRCKRMVLLLCVLLVVIEVMSGGAVSQTIFGLFPTTTDCTDAKQSGMPCWNNSTFSVGDGSNNIVIGGKETKTVYLDAGAFSVDATNCASPTEITINSGPKKWAVTCGDSNASIFYFSVHMPDRWDGGTITVRAVTVNTNATPSGVLDFDISCQCKRDGDTISNTWGTVQNFSITYATQNVEEIAVTAAHTPNGTCTSPATLFCKGVMDAASTTTQVASTYLLGVTIEYGTSTGTD